MSDRKLITEKMGALIRSQRLELKMTLAELSKRTGIALTTLAHYENGSCAPSLPSAIKVSKVLWIDLNELKRLV